MANTKILAVIFAATLLSGCQANKGYRDFMTKGANAFHDIKLEVTPDVKNVATIENLQINRKPQKVSSFVVSGTIKYDQSCHAALILGVSILNAQQVVLRNTKEPIQSYIANTTARFSASAYLSVRIGEPEDVIDKVVINEIKCV